MKTPSEARDIGHSYKGFADHLREQGLLAEARRNEQHGRLDRIEGRFERIERRLDLVEG